MFTTFHEYTVIQLRESTETVPECFFDYIARGQHVEDHLHVVTGQRTSDVDTYESVPSPHVSS